MRRYYRRLYGLAGVVAVSRVGPWVDRRPHPALLVCCAAVVAALALLAVSPRSIVAVAGSVVLWGAGFTALPICLQSAVLRVAPRMPDTGSALYVVAFQIGIGGGSLIGAGLLGGGHVASLPVVAAVLVSVGLAIAVVAGRTLGRLPQVR